MTAVALRGLLSRKLRTALTMVAIILGVAMIAGTYVLTDTINSSFAQIFSTANKTTDAVLTGKSVFSAGFQRPPTLPSSLLSIVQRTPGVAVAEGRISDTAGVYTLQGKAIGATGGAPTLLFSNSLPRFRQVQLVSGHWPSGREVVLDQGTEKRAHLHVGQTVKVAAEQGAELFTISGFIKFGNVSSIGGATLVEMDLAAAQHITGKQGRFDIINVGSSPGVSQTEVVRRIQTRIPASLRPTVKVETGTQNAASQQKQISQGLQVLTIALLAFGAIAVFVGAFVIFNTFSITVAQRLREFALLRTVGATRGQVLRSVLLEALLIGVVASIVGLLAGVGLAQALNGLFLAFGIDLPKAGLVILPRTVIVGLAVGILITVASSFMPAVRATHIPPVAALREGAVLPRSRFARFVSSAAALVTVLGVGLLAFGVLGSISSASGRLTLIGVGAFLLFLGVAMFSPKLVPPLASAIGWPIERGTAVTGELARQNTIRNPTRTAVTAAALMVGLAIIGFVTILAAELVKTADDTVTRNFAGSYAISSSQEAAVPGGVAPAVAGIPGVQTVSASTRLAARVNGIGSVSFTGVEPASLTRLYHFQWQQGSDATFRSMGPHDAVIDNNLASGHHLHVGSTLRLTTPVGVHETVRVVGIYKQSIFFPDACIQRATFVRDWKTRTTDIVLVGIAPGATLKGVQNSITRLLNARFPGLQVQTEQQFKDDQQKSVNQLLALIYVLLALSVIVSLFGIINTLVLSIYERTREIGMLRAIGTTRGQVRWMIRWESVITSVIGAVLGLLLGVVLSVLVTSGLSSQGIEYAWPIRSLLIWLVFAILFGIVAAAWPARRAARLDVLQAIAYE